MPSQTISMPPPVARAPRLDHLRLLEAESLHIIREVVAEFERPVMLYSIGKDSSVMLRLAQKAFYPAPIPFPLLHVDTTYKFREMIAFRDRYPAMVGARLIVHTNRQAIADGAQPFVLGTQRCCGLLKTQALLDALTEGGFDAAFGGARRDEERSRAKERVFSLRNDKGQWDPKRQRPELWHLLNSRISPGESIRVFPLSNWTELDVWHYIDVEKIPVVPLYFAKPREVIVRGSALQLVEQPFVPLAPGRAPAARDLPHALARLLPVHRRRALGGRHRPENHRGARLRPALGAAAARDRPRPGQLDGDEEAGRIFLMSGLLRICTAGSVDDGKSTLIGRLLYDSRGVYEDQIRSVTAASRNRSAGPIDFSLFTDGLKAEREQGITIDVAYRYFATARRKWILADTPGHEQYTRNMATGASTADVAILLVDARHGVRDQTRRHAKIARLLGISRFVLAVNKMDLVDFDEEVFDSTCADFSGLLGDAQLHAIPLSALHGDNVITRSDRTPWFDGFSLLEYLETVDVDGEAAGRPFRFPVQLAVRPDHEFRGSAGQIAVGHGPRGGSGHHLARRPDDAHRADRDVGRRPGRGVRADVGDAGVRGRRRRQPRGHHRDG